MLSGDWYRIASPVGDVIVNNTVVVDRREVSIDFASAIDTIARGKRDGDHRGVTSLTNYNNHLALLGSAPTGFVSNHQLINLIKKHSGNTRFIPDKCADVVLVTKAYEDSYLRLPNGGEEECVCGSGCEALMVAKLRGCDGFTPVRFRIPNRNTSERFCLLCLRKHVAYMYYDNADRDGCVGTVIQPYYNMTDVVGEYRKECVLFPTSPTKFQGLVHPFVRYERHHYDYVDGRLVQVNVDFFQAPRFVGNFTTPLGIHFAPRSPLPEVCDESILQSLGMRSCDEFGRPVVMTLSDMPDIVHLMNYCSFFYDKTKVEEIPLVKIISRVLPYRCQFKNFQDCCMTHLRNFRHVGTFLRMVLWYSLSGAYPHCMQPAPPSYRAYLLSFMTDVNNTGIIEFVKKNYMLTYIAVKELVVFLTPYDVALHTILVKRRRWNTFTSSVIGYMNTYRARWYAGEMDKIIKMTSGVSDKSLVCTYNGNISRFYDVVVGASTVAPDITRGDLVHHFDPSIVYRPFEDIFNVLMTLFPCIRMNSVVMDLLQLYRIHYNESNDLAIKTHVVKLCDKYPTTMSSVVGMFHLYREAILVQEIALTRDMMTNHTLAIVRKYKMHSFVPGLETSGDCLFCPSCSTLKGFVEGLSNDKNRKNQKHIQTALGNHDVVSDYISGNVFCASSSKKKRKAASSLIRNIEPCIDTPCRVLNVFGKLIVFFGSMVTTCFECGTLTIFDFSRWRNGVFRCVPCTNDLNERDFFMDSKCLFCQSENRCGDSRFYVFRNGRFICGGLCIRHSGRMIPNDSIIDYGVFLSMMD